MHSIMTKQYFFVSHCVPWNHQVHAIIEEDYYEQSDRFQILFGKSDQQALDERMKQLSKLHQLDYEGTQYVRNNKQQYTNMKKRRKMKTELCNKNVYINQLFEHYEYYESKSEILKQQIKHIEFTISVQVDPDASVDTLLDIFDLQIIRKEMLCCDIALKLNEIHRVLDEHPCSNGKVCKDGKSKEEFAPAVVDGQKTYNKY
eukprot:UN05519